MRDEFGPLIWEALNAFRESPDYLTDMVEAANKLGRLRTRDADRHDEDDPVRQRLIARTRKRDGHWIWEGDWNPNGAPSLYFEGCKRSARVLWVLEVNPDHDRGVWPCESLRACVNPAHTVRALPKKTVPGRAPKADSDFGPWLQKCLEERDEHWVWIGHSDTNGPCYYRYGKRVVARVGVYEFHKGLRPPINSRRCGTLADCVNPDHTRSRSNTD